MTRTEQESICLRYFDHNLIPHEEFVGLYEVSLTTGQNYTGLSYTSTTTGTVRSRGASGPHCVNLITQATCVDSSVVRNALQWVHELGHVFGQDHLLQYCHI